MKTVKSRLIYSVVLFLVGIAFLIAGLVRQTDGIMPTLAFSYMVCSIVRFVQYYKIYKDEDRRKAYEISITEERIAYIANKARSLTFALSIYAAFAVSIVFFLVGQIALGKVLFYFVAVEGLGYMIILKYYDKKY